MISRDKSYLSAVEAILNENLNVRGLLSIFTYSFEEADKNFKKYNCIKNSLCDYKTLINEALKSNYIQNKDVEILEQWRNDPKNWPA